MTIGTETLPAIGSLSGPLQNLTSFYKSLTYVNKTTLQVLQKFNSTLLHLTIQFQSLLLRIEDYSFIWTPNLVTLNLGNNAINYLAKYAFSGLVTLQELSLASNDLKAVPSDALDVFREFASLKHFDLSYNSISDNIANDTVSGISASLSSLKLSIKKTLSVNSVTWVNKLQKLNYLLLESTETVHRLDASRYPLFSLQKLDIIHFYVYFSPCFAFPNLKSLTMVDTFIYNFPADLALRECYNLRVLSLSHFESDINTFDDEHLNITIPFLHTHWQ